MHADNLPLPFFYDEKLVHFLGRSLEFANRFLALVDSQYDDFVASCRAYNADQDLVVDKLLAEAALLAFVAGLSKPGPDIEEAVQALWPRIARWSRRDLHKALLLHDPRTGAGLALTHTLLQQNGWPDSEFESLLADALRQGEHFSVARPIFREMEIRWLEGIRADTPPEFGDLLEESISARAPHPLRMTMGDFYALTHEVFFITDFGRRVVPSIICRHKIAALLNNCILAHVASNDLDLLGELLIAHFVVRAEISPAVVIGAQLVFRTWDEYGFLPARNLDLSLHESAPAAQKPFHAYLGSYHSTFVGGILAATMLNRDRWNCGKALSARTGANNATWDWQKHIRQYQSPILDDVLLNTGLTQYELEESLAEAVLIGAARRRDVPLAKRGVFEWRRTGLPENWTFRETSRWIVEFGGEISQPPNSASTLARGP